MTSGLIEIFVFVSDPVPVYKHSILIKSTKMNFLNFISGKCKLFDDYLGTVIVC